MNVKVPAHATSWTNASISASALNNSCLSRIVPDEILIALTISISKKSMILSEHW